MPVWILIVIALPLYTFIVEVYLERHHSARNTPTYGRTLIRFFGWNLNQPCQRLPDVTHAKCLFCIWIIYSFVITSFYSGNLTSYLLFRPRLPDIGNLKELEQSDYKILTIDRYTDLITEMTVGDRSFAGRVDIRSPSDFYQHLRVKDTKYAYANKHHINAYILNFEQLHETYVEVDECIVPYINVYALSYGSPYKGRINSILQRIQSAGIYDLWIKVGMRKATFRRIRRTLKRHPQTDNSEIPLSIYHLQTAFYLWFFGCILSTCVFCAETLYAKLNGSLNRRISRLLFTAFAHTRKFN